ncbi:TIGR01244 family protein [Erythrobacter sp. QSSC1-22B]|uniref:TIGR01244 family sulfur transferase n=1 Tax=Erythrobacter sp. QSSC1-22B TaxID=1860125 RepID=UPI000805F50F|nr:TIGR01244 family sulfur transferase [Erythrobacter sp. QSSC1-22B]OBX18557.1 TIGR01244 family protein [Erythrobacter sp. QSSC1-22B]
MQYTRISDRLAVGPQIEIEDLATLAQDGFTGIVNNRPDGEAQDQPMSRELAAEASRLGLAYWHIPVVLGATTDAETRDFAPALRDADGPVLAFCRTGNRSSTLWEAAQTLLS